MTSRTAHPILLILAIALIGGCRSAAPNPQYPTAMLTPTLPPSESVTAPGWSGAQVIAIVHTPIFQPALTILNGQAVIGWWERDLANGIAHLTFSRGADSPPIVTGTIGHQPDQLNLFSTSYGLLAIWRDQNAASINPTDRRLYAALFDSNFAAIRAPTSISERATTAYSAVQLATGDLVIGWTGHDSAVANGTVADGLWLTNVDVTGTAAKAIRIAPNVAHPTLTIAAADQVIAGWLSPQPGAIWAIQAAAIAMTRPTARSITFDVSAVHTLGLLQPGAINGGSLIDSLTIAAQGTVCTMLWSVAPLNPTYNATLSTLSFPCASLDADPATVAPVPLAADLIPGGEWPGSVNISTIQMAGASTPIGLTLTDLKNGDVAGVAWLTAGSTAVQISRIDRLNTAHPLLTIGRVALAADSYTGKLSAAWGAIAPDGTARIMFAQQQ